MNELSDSFLLVTLAILLIISGFFSSSETGMMSLNPYKLKHRVKQGNRAATRANSLLEKPDRLIGIILIGNNLVNIGASSIATVLAIRWFGDAAGPAIATIALTIIILIFAEVTPKTVAANYPEKIAFPASAILKPLLIILMPFVWLVNHASNLLLMLFGIRPNRSSEKHSLSNAELKTVVEEGGHLISPTYKGMLLNIIDLDDMTVEDIMVPRTEVISLDIEDEMRVIEEVISSSEYTRLPVVNGDINNVMGVLHLRNALPLFKKHDSFPKSELLEAMHEPYFVPESTPLSTMLLNFQKEQRRIGLVVDEYGDVQGLVTIEDLLEEIVGRFTTDNNESDDEVIANDDGSALIDATALIRDVNKTLGWNLPTDGPKTVNGLIVEHLERIPSAPVCVKIYGYTFEVTAINAQRIGKVVARPY